MTNKSVLKAKIGFPIPDETIEVHLIDAGIGKDDEYSKDLQKEMDLCAAGLIYWLLTNPDIAEGDFSQKMASADKLKLAYTGFVNKWGAPNLLEDKTEEPTVTGVSPW